MKIVKTEVSNSNRSEGQLRTNKVTRGPHYAADATMAVLQPYKEQLLHLISSKVIVGYMHIVSGRLYVR